MMIYTSVKTLNPRFELSTRIFEYFELKFICFKFATVTEIFQEI
jgi:hypothetical protein